MEPNLTLTEWMYIWVCLLIAVLFISICLWAIGKIILAIKSISYGEVKEPRIFRVIEVTNLNCDAGCDTCNNQCDVHNYQSLN